MTSPTKIKAKPFSTTKTHSPDGSLTGSEQKRRDAAWAEQRPAVARCALDGCDWTFEGTVASCRDACREHRQAEHPGRSGRLPSWDAKRAVAAVRAFIAEHGRAPTKKEGDARDDLPSGSVAARHCGSWLNMVALAKGERSGPLPRRRAGVQPNARWTTVTAPAAIQAWAEQHGRPPTSAEAAKDPGLPTQQIGTRLYGSWASMVEASGFPRPRSGVRQNYPKVSPLREDAAAVGVADAASSRSGPAEGEQAPEKTPSGPAREEGGPDVVESVVGRVGKAAPILVDRVPSDRNWPRKNMRRVGLEKALAVLEHERDLLDVTIDYLRRRVEEMA